METKDNSASWCWTVQRRCLPFDSELFWDGDQFCHMGWKQLPVEYDPFESDSSETKVLCSIAGCSAVFNSLKKYEAHYNITHQHVCSICHKIMPSAHLLEIHILETHDNMFGLLAASKNMYQCLLESCTERFPTASSRREHMKKVHKYPANFRFDRKKQDRKKSQTSSKSCIQMSQKVKTEPYPVEVSSLMDVCTVMESSEMASNVDLIVAQLSTCLSTENDLDVEAKGNYTPDSIFNTDTFKKQRKKATMQLPADVDNMSTDLRNLKQCRTGQETFSSTSTETMFQTLTDSGSVNSMEDCNTDQVSHKAPARKFTYKVPQNICFGHGSAKSFQRSKKGFSKKKHWHSTACDDTITKVNIENVDMSDLSSVLMDQ